MKSSSPVGMEQALEKVSGSQPDGTREEKTRGWSFWFSILFSAAAFCIALMHFFDTNCRYRVDGPLAGVLIAAALPWVLNRIQTLKAGGLELTMVQQRLGIQDLRIVEQQKVLGKQQQELKDQQTRMHDLFLSSMEADMFDTLNSLLVRKDFSHNKDDPNYTRIAEQMRYLFGLGYLSRHPDEIPHGEKIGDGRIVTEEGRKYIKARQELSKSLAQA